MSKVFLKLQTSNNPIPQENLVCANDTKENSDTKDPVKFYDSLTTVNKYTLWKKTQWIDQRNAFDGVALALKFNGDFNNLYWLIKDYDNPNSENSSKLYGKFVENFLLPIGLNFFSFFRLSYYCYTFKEANLTSYQQLFVAIYWIIPLISICTYLILHMFGTKCCTCSLAESMFAIAIKICHVISRRDQNYASDYDAIWHSALFFRRLYVSAISIIAIEIAIDKWEVKSLLFGLYMWLYLLLEILFLLIDYWGTYNMSNCCCDNEMDKNIRVLIEHKRQKVQ